MYSVHIESRPEKELDHLPKQIYERVIEHIKTLRENPRPHGCRKIAGSKQDWRIRVGDYRVIYEIDDTNKEIHIMRVRHRGEAYR